MSSIKTVIVALVVAISSRVHASMLCDVVETVGQNQTTQHLTVDIQNDNPHGSLLFFKLSQFTQFSGMIAYLRGYSVISIHELKSGFAISSQSKLTGDDLSHQQILLPTPDLGIKSITVDCKLSAQP